MISVITIIKLPAATFNNQLTMAEFGILPNNNISLQSASRYTSDPAGQLLRTNDFQALQLNFNGYATGRLPTREGLFTVSESAVSLLGGLPFGSRVELGSYTNAGDQAANIEPNRFLTLVQNPNFILYNFSEAFASADIRTDMSNSETFLSFDVTYSSGGGFMTSYHVHGNAYHDIQYQDLTPRLTFGSGELVGLEVDNIVILLPSSGTTFLLPAGTKFKFTFSNPEGVPPQTQTWLVYAQTFTGETIQFNMEYALTSATRIREVELTASATFDGFLRTAAIQTSAPLAQENQLAQRTSPGWQLATQIQSIPATPLSMFMLWPYDWTKTVGVQLAFNQANNVFLSACTANSLLIPLLARSDYATATCWYNQLIDKQNRGETVFDSGTNAFVTLMNMLIAHYYDAEILSYQNGIARGVSTPALSLGSNASALEQMFDNHRSEIPLNAELIFNANDTYSFLLTSLDLFSTLPLGSTHLPLQSLPGFKTMVDGFNLQPYANAESIKGDVAYTEANFASVPGDFVVTFKAQAPPSWAGRFLPDDFWSHLLGADMTNLGVQLQQQLARPVPGLSSDTYEQGKRIFQAAMTAKYATYVLLAQLGMTPPYLDGLVVPASVTSAVQPLIDYIEDILEAWLASKIYRGESLSNFFCADDDAKGVVAYIGTTTTTSGNLDSGNAVYTGHNRQYGYFLEAAAIATELDQLFGNPLWIASTITALFPTPPFPAATPPFLATAKQFVDMLWRDYANPVTDDAADMPFNRYGNPWEGMSCEKGVPPTGTYPSRYNTSISEDFNGYYAAWLYARAIRNAPTAEISNTNKEGFHLLERYSKVNFDMVMRAAKGMFYNTSVWVYTNTPFNFNQTTGVEWDNEANTSPINMSLLTPPCGLTREGCIYSKYKFDLFGKDLVDSFNSRCACTEPGCDCH